MLSMEGIDRCFGMFQEIFARFPGPFFTRVTLPLDKVFEFSSFKFEVHDFFHDVFFLVVDDF